MNRTQLQRIQNYAMREKAIWLMPLVAIWLGLALSPHYMPFWDSGIYINMGNSIAKGDGSKYLGHAFKYPPIFPFMLALIIIPFGYNFLLMRALIVALGVGSIWLSYLIVRDRSNRWIATGVVVSTAVSFPIVFESTRILSDIPYMFFSLLAIRWVERYASRSDAWRSKSGYIAIGLMVVTFFTRIVGATLLAGATAYFVLGGARLPRSRTSLKKAVAIGIITIIVPTMWLTRNALNKDKFPPELRQGLSYERELFSTTTENPDAPTVRWKEFWERLKENEKYYEGLFSNIAFGKSRRSETHARVITLILLGGYLLCAFKHRTLVEYYAFFYILTYILWPAHQRERFLVPVIPFLFYYLFRFLEQIVSGMRWLLRRFAHWEDRRKLTEILAILVLTGVFVLSHWKTDMRIIRYETREPYYTGRYGVLVKLTQWLIDNTPDATVIMSAHPDFVQVLFEQSAPNNATNRKTFGFPWLADRARLLQFMDRLGVGYVISVPSGKTKTYLHPVFKQYPTRFGEAHRYGKYVIYRMVSPEAIH
jgi:hypothetical protein